MEEIAPFLEWLKTYAASISEVKKVYLFGSFARGDFGPTSDIDLAFEYIPSKSAFWSKFAEDLKRHAKTIRGLDVVNLAEVGKDFSSEILREGVIIFERK